MASPVPALSPLKLQTNVPERIALQFPTGRNVQSPYTGDQVMYSLTDGRRMYLPPHVADKIAGLELGPREEFTICKRETAHGNRRVVEYHVERIEPEPLPLPVWSLQPAGKDYSAELAASLPATQSKPAADVLTLTGIEAINAVLAVEAYARSRGLASFEFGADNIQKVWISLYIDQARGGRR
jgi:hypothetical protein